MSTLGLFAAGAFVTLMVAASLSLLVWAAILDGRDEEARRLARLEQEAVNVRPLRSTG